MNLVQRQAKLLRLLAAASYPGCSMREVARQLDLPPSTTHRLLKALCDTKLVAQDSETQQYRLGSEALYLAGLYLERIGITDLVAPYLERLTSRTGLVSFSAIRDRDAVLCTSVRTPPETTNFYVRVGKMLPPHASASAKALIYGLERSQLSRILSQSLEHRFTGSTLTSVDAVVADLERGRRLGYWECNEELEPDVYAVAAPILSGKQQPIASLTLVGHHSRERDSLKRVASTVVEVAHDASAEIGRLLQSGQLVGNE